ncbi:hypothetical protein [Parvibaculum sp.]|nr:hypothetical protein [Parvibaculum sp.]MDP3327159.1 hypothetical protein [Parvibaculum sp.]
MLATATHDHKRGEDVRTRLAVLSEVPEEWRRRVERWQTMNRTLTFDIEPADVYMLYQTLFGTWPTGLIASDAGGLAALGERIAAWQKKALREAELRSSWEAPDEDYERRCLELTGALLDPARSAEFLSDFTDFIAWTEPAARANSLVQTALRCVVPGVPDLYQGAELPDLSLVDPDNRRPVDYDLRRGLLTGEDVEASEWARMKFALIVRLLDDRRNHPLLFANGNYEPIAVRGLREKCVLAFRRRSGEEELVCAVAFRCAAALLGGKAVAPPAHWWDDTVLDISATDAFGDGRAATLFADGPVFVSVRRI